MEGFDFCDDLFFEVGEFSKKQVDVITTVGLSL
jgi:hypothetical protein